MSKIMLIDSLHEEDKRVVLLKNNQIEEFEYQSRKKHTKGNIYLAKVTRVEPSLQAAFVDYGSEKHGFLPFSEIHPDYYQLPTADRDKLKAEIAQIRKQKLEKKDDTSEENPLDIDSDSATQEEVTQKVADNIEQIDTELSATSLYDEEDTSNLQFHHRYKVQEVIKKDQIILVQVEKEERSSKGASLTTYISLAGRYCVFMPNATKAGGISKKIEDNQDRSRLKKISKDLTLKCGDTGSVIIRTAGAFKTKTEITRDLSYLQRLWDNIRGMTVKSSAPYFILEEGDMIKKSIRDLYEADVEQVIISGKNSFDEAKNFMQMILPKHVSKLKEYKGNVPIFSKFGIDEKLAAMYDNKVNLPSGGYLIINITEALVAIDINSGRSTSERSIESTALKTNMEAAEEIARQIKLRDLSGLIVIDFIDMEESKNRKTIEKTFRECLINDRAKIRLGRISSFGLLEMSRQRLNPSFIESNTHTCQHCDGRGRVRPVNSTAIVILRAIENELGKHSNIAELSVSGSKDLVFYLLNEKRKQLDSLETKYQVKIILDIDESAGGDGFFFETKKARKKKEKHASENNTISISDIEYTAAEKNNEQPFSDEDEKDSDEDDIVSEQSRERKKKYNLKKKNKNNKFKTKVEKREKNRNVGNSASNTHVDEVVFDNKNNEEDLASKRRKNQSLLQEIWKKIVD